MDPAIKKFFDVRKEAWLKKNKSPGMEDWEKKEKDVECEKIFSIEEWLPKASQRAASRAFSSHPSKFSHSSTGVGPKNRKNYTYVTPVICKAHSSSDGFLRSGNVVVELDSLGNAAELDVNEFLAMIMQDGQRLLTHIETDTDLAKKLLNTKSQSYEELKKGFLAMVENDVESVTSSKIKQVYFPAEGAYHQLSILTPSGIVFDLRRRLDTLRFGIEVDGVNDLKEAKEKKRKNEYHKTGYREIYGLTGIGYGGTQPQNISVLNSKNAGKAYLLLSAPPAFTKRDIHFPYRDFFTQSVSYFKYKSVFRKLHEIYEAREQNKNIRKARDAYYKIIIDQIIEKMWLVRSISAEQYSSQYSQLKNEQKIWLLDEKKTIRESEDEWLDIIILAITQFIFHGYEKVLAKRAIKLGDAEYQHIKNIVEKYKESLR